MFFTLFNMGSPLLRYTLRVRYFITVFPDAAITIIRPFASRDICPHAGGSWGLRHFGAYNLEPHERRLQQSRFWILPVLVEYAAFGDHRAMVLLCPELL